MISQDIQFCQEEKCELLSCSKLFKILEVREGSQRKLVIASTAIPRRLHVPNTPGNSPLAFSKIPISRKAAPISTPAETCDDCLTLQNALDGEVQTSCNERRMSPSPSAREQQSKIS
ncbi:hypothetical protein P5673_024482 [Acropora cervicornis]|uniref:Uncharacterized protein n=1 Tax=Acropora cervicornis TaxID=6130 RepID=A0AAD9Q3K4_ACRCE|nr:hypothetical protein P5673_024482 [Acropora cervicornis]